MIYFEDFKFNFFKNINYIKYIKYNIVLFVNN